MRYVAAAISLILALYLGVGSIVDYRDYASEAPIRANESLKRHNDKLQLENDELSVANEEMQLEIDQEQHRKNDGVALYKAKALMGADKFLVDMEDDFERSEPPLASPNVIGLRGFAAAVLLIAALVIFPSSGNKPLDANTLAAVSSDGVGEGTVP